MEANDKEIVTGNAKFLRELNTQTILRLIRERQPISRVKIAKLTGLSKPTVSSIIAELLQEDLIFEKVGEGQGVGRNPVNLSLKLGKHFVGAIEIDSPVTNIGITDIDGRMISISSILTDVGTPKATIAKCVKELRTVCTSLKIDQLKGLGVSVPGIVSSEGEIVEFAPNLSWRNFGIRKMIQKFIPDVRDITIGNGAKLAALAELWFGTHETDLTNFVFLSITPGIGSGIVIGKRLLEGENQESGEFGHMVINDGGELCSCGNSGCLEAYASDRATASRYSVKAHEANMRYSMEAIISKAREGDTNANDVLRQTGYYLGLGISNIVKTIDPHAIIIGGLITQVWDIVYPEIMEVVRTRAYFGRTKGLEILPTSLKVPPRLLGAAAVAIEKMFLDYGPSS